MSKPRYIDANKISLRCEKFITDEGDLLISLRDVNRAIQETPTEDLIDVVRCRDCIFYAESYVPICIKQQGLVCPNVDGYCSYGKRKGVVDENNQN